jgi:aerobic carbon-monoxide dehydrogenase medium subunit
MKPAPFRYHAPGRLEEALELLADDEQEARAIAGGQSLVPMMNFRLATPEVLVDLGRIDALRYVRTRSDGALAIGAGARQATVLRERPDWPLLSEAIRHIGHPQIRSRGTVCGSLAHHDPTAELPAVATALGATMTVAGTAGTRTVAADAFFVSYYEVALEPGELLIEAAFPAPEPGTGWAFKELARRRGDFALVGAAALLRRESGAASEPRLVLFGVGDRAQRIGPAEALLNGAPVNPDTLDELRAIVADAVDPIDDVHASADYRREAVAQLVVECVADAWGRCDG